ncbi:MAG: OsmC family protein [Bdellovibrionaceae bacterium]|nr:OsmC family protein [Pseudobdellovibrionaceae bacterium]
MRYPIEFHSQSESKRGVQQTWTCTSAGQTVNVAIPPEFAGPGGGLSPEDLFNQALTNCFLATFKVYAENSRLEYEKIRAESLLTVDLNEEKKPVMKKLEVRVIISGAHDIQKARLLAEKAARSGFILNSVKTVCNFSIQFE